MRSGQHWTLTDSSSDTRLKERHPRIHLEHPDKSDVVEQNIILGQRIAIRPSHGDLSSAPRDYVGSLTQILLGLASPQAHLGPYTLRLSGHQLVTSTDPH
jgi:hypothetical protein